MGISRQQQPLHEIAKLVIFPVFLTNSRLKSLENFIQGHRFILLKSILGASDLQSLSKLFLPCWAFLFFLFSLKLLINVVTFSEPIRHLILVYFRHLPENLDGKIEESLKKIGKLNIIESQLNEMHTKITNIEETVCSLDREVKS